jgi:hypothetical protein
MPIKLKVPLVAQSLQNDCWYAAACMVAYYFEAGPRLGLPAKWVANKGINPTLGDFAALARVEHLEPISASNRVWDEKNLEVLLRKDGPVWCAGSWFGLKHIIVLTGVDSTNVYFNDPDGGKAKSGTLAWFNQKLDKQLPECMMRHKR